MRFQKHLAGVIGALIGIHASFDGIAQTVYSTDRENLMVVLRESRGANKIDSKLKPSGSGTATRRDGKQIEVNPAWFDFIGDMHIRFVYDGPDSMRVLTL